MPRFGQTRLTLATTFLSGYESLPFGSEIRPVQDLIDYLSAGLETCGNSRRSVSPLAARVSARPIHAWIGRAAMLELKTDHHAA